MESKRSKKNRDFLGYYLPTNTLILSIIAIFTTLNFVVTYWVQIPIPATGGYINIGDIAIMFIALLFGPIIGGITGGLGPMLADVFSPYIIYAPATVVIKGIEGFLIGLISNPKNCEGRVSYHDIIAVLIGGVLIPLGYFIYEAFILGFGVIVALVEMPGNFFQFILAAIGSILLVTASIKNSSLVTTHCFDKIFISIEPRNYEQAKS